MYIILRKYPLKIYQEFDNIKWENIFYYKLCSLMYFRYR